MGGRDEMLIKSFPGSKCKNRGQDDVHEYPGDKSVVGSISRVESGHVHHACRYVFYVQEFHPLDQRYCFASNAAIPIQVVPFHSIQFHSAKLGM